MEAAPAALPPILFLDIDGVMNSEESVHRWGRGDRFTPGAVATLRQMLDRTGARVVITSTWRLSYSLPRLRRVFDDNGIPGERIWGVTPDYSRHPAASRGDEIDAWLEKHGSDRPFWILDDEPDLEPHLDKWIPTDARVGLLGVVWNSDKGKSFSKKCSSIIYT